MSQAVSRRPWSWKVEDREQNARLDLRYEPGCWGDVIKGLFAVAAVRALGRTGLRLLDPFAGAPRYPRLATTAARLDLVTGLPLDGAAAALVRDWRALHDQGGADAWPSTATLVRRAAGDASTLEVFELDPARRERWAAEPAARVLPLESGWQALGSQVQADLTLVDPYDLDADLPRLRAALGATPGVLVLYLFNRAPRGSNELKAYRRLRDELAAGVAPRGVLCGRLPSDAVLPRTWHEALLVAPPALLVAVQPALEEVTRALAGRIAADGAFEAEAP